MRVLFLTLYPETMPSSRLRVYQYLPFLAAHGVQADCLPAVPEPWFSRLYFSKSRLAKFVYCLWETLSFFARIRSARGYDLVFVQKGILSTNLRGFEKKLIRSAKRLIYDFDDDVLGRILTEFRLPPMRALQDAAQTLKIARAADSVIAGNAYLRQRVARENSEVSVLPTPVDTDRLCPRAESGMPSDETVLGWIGMEIGLPYLRTLAPVLQELSRRYPLRLKIISRLTRGAAFEMPGVKTQFVNWSYDSEVREMQEFDIGLMPVTEDTWGPGKCGLKLLQYMALGIASVASRIGANREIVTEDVDACLAFSPQEWIEKLSPLIESPEKRRKMGQAARAKVLEHYSLKALAPQFVRIIKNTCHSEPSVCHPERSEGSQSEIHRRFSVTYILPQMDIGGSEAHGVRLAEGLRRRGHDARILCVFEEGRLAPWIREKKIPLEALHAKRWGPGVMRKIRQNLEAQPADIVHTYLFGLHFFAGMAARRAKVKAVVSSRRDVELSQPAKVLWLEKCGNFFADRVVACSEAVRQWALPRENLKQEKIVTIYNGVDLAEFVPGRGREEIRREFGIPAGACIIGTVANFSAKKGYPYLIEAAAKILEARPDCFFLFVGGGPLEGAMRAKAAALTGGKNVLFASSRRDVARLLAAMDVFAFASLWEGLPNVVLEAMAMALPVVSTPAGGVPEVITDGENGRMVPFRDPQAMARVILELLDQPEKSAALGRAARKKIEEEFTLERMIDQYEKFYAGILNRKHQTKMSAPDALIGDLVDSRQKHAGMTKDF